MKNTKQRMQFFVLLVASVLILSSCKKSSTTSDSTTIINLPAPISNIVSQSMIDSLKAVGVAIHEGTTPPVVNGIFLMHPDSCIYDNSPGQFTGLLFDDYKFKFTDQNNSLFTLSVAQKDVVSGTLSSTPVSSYISGSGNDFSIFILRTTSPSGIAIRQFNVLSGTLIATGIKNFQNTYYLQSKKGDSGNTIAPAGTIRLFVNGGSGLAIISTTF
jgi:hypothetical protein